MLEKRRIPFIPYSNCNLRMGDFWAIMLEDETFAAGCVLDPLQASSRVEFFGALLAWHGSTPPTAEALECSRTLMQGYFHVRIIAKSGGIVGHCKLLNRETAPPASSNPADAERRLKGRRRILSPSRAPNALWMEAHRVFLGYSPDRLNWPPLYARRTRNQL